jgi:hypothetical protein
MGGNASMLLGNDPVEICSVQRGGVPSVAEEELLVKGATYRVDTSVGIVTLESRFLRWQEFVKISWRCDENKNLKAQAHFWLICEETSRDVAGLVRRFFDAVETCHAARNFCVPAESNLFIKPYEGRGDELVLRHGVAILYSDFIASTRHRDRVAISYE